ncbi:MAG: zinc metalloprotease [Williamsia sp.]|nr:zinc metalloprotease [Williamsia sp.]
MFTRIYLPKILLVALCVFLALPFLQAQQKDTTRRRCGSDLSYLQLINSKDGAFAQRYKQIDQFTRSYIQHLRQLRKEGISGYRTSPIIIPVVVHVVYQIPEQNVSLAQIQSQIDVLNHDYRRLNSDISLVPGAFNPFTSDCMVEFRLAVRDPNCMATTGVTRTSTSVSQFSLPTDAQSTQLAYNPVKSSAAGGHDAWPADKYLNIWVCKLASGYLGYSSFPGFPANVDGVVIDYQAFGTSGSAASPYNLGRTATHEIGHWMNLHHIWGDDGDGCTGSDQVDDTPNQAGPNYSCRSFPFVTCSNGPNGDMFMNYMDYTPDACMNMFTTGQSERIDGALYGARSALLASDALVPVTGATTTTPDLYMQDTPEDQGVEPNTISTYMYNTEDVWVRNADDGLTYQEHQNPVYRPVSSGNPNYVYVRVRNRSCAGASATGTLKLYWGKASSALGWSAPWDGSVTSPALMGGSISAVTSASVSVAPGGFQIVKFSWYPPNPSDYASFGADQSHFCLLARIETSSAPPYGMTSPETNNLWANVQNNNNIVWKNLSVVGEVTGGRSISSLTVGNFGSKAITSKIYFQSIWSKLQENFLQYGQVTVELSKELYDKWSKADKAGSGFRVIDSNRLVIATPAAWLGPFDFKGGEVYNMKFLFEFNKKIPFNSTRSFGFNVEQTSLDAAGKEQPMGGETFIIKSQNDEPAAPFTGDLKVQIKAWLQGAYQAADKLMTDSIRGKAFLPGTTPYPNLKFVAANNPVDELTDMGVLETEGADAITDWVWVELRKADTAAKVVATRSALIRRDGRVVDIDGVSPVSFSNLDIGSYYVALRHRNHLGVMTIRPVQLSRNSITQIDFTDPNTPTYGTEAQLSQNGVMMLRAGDANGDGRIRYNGSSNDKNAVLSKVGLNTSNNILPQYDRTDINLDGKIRYNGAANDKNEILKSAGLSTPNRVITEQIPN